MTKILDISVVHGDQVSASSKDLLAEDLCGQQLGVGGDS